MDIVVNATRLDSARDTYSWTGTGLKNKELLAERETMRNLYCRMQLSRKFEERALELLKAGYIHGTMHPSVGEEAAHVGATAALEEQDVMFATHRGHSQAIGKGFNLRDMMSEMFGRENGTNHGRGGSMHLADPTKGILGANAILGASAPIACGAALALQMEKRENAVAVDFFGDGASNEGAIHEAMNLAAAWKLPVIFCIINNTYGFSTPLNRSVNDVDLAKRGIPYGIHTVEVDGNDVLAVYETMREAREYVITNREPVLIIEHTYRTCGHSKSDKNLYRSQEEIETWLSRNPTERFRKVLMENHVFSEEELAAMDRRTTEIIDDAVEYAKAGPEPSPEHVLDRVWSD